MSRRPESDSGGFPATRWSDLRRTYSSDGPDAREALERVLGVYLPVLRSFLTSHRGMSTEQADEIVQGFVAERILERDLIRRADPGRGMFRSYLLRSLLNYLASGTAAQRRHGSNVPLEDAPEPVATRDSREFAKLWLSRLVDEVLVRMRRQLEEKKREDIWKIFEARLVRPLLNGECGTRYLKLIEQVEGLTTKQASNLLITGRRTFGRILGQMLSEYTGTSDEVAEEIAALKASCRAD